MNRDFLKIIDFLQMRAEDRRFIEYWEEQKKGSRAGYYITYTIAWSVVSFLLLFFLSKLLTNLWKTGGSYLIYVFIVISVFCGYVITNLAWTKNEKRLKRLTDQLNKEEQN
ncbi:MAG: hypothetical protein J5I50_02935 [Chitinophagaceae bacterium]|nr:hypothetical protein [Chitinophagaceae bacterium]